MTNASAKPESAAGTLDQDQLDTGFRQFQTWHICMVQDCNLRCTYCSTSFGSFGFKRGWMSARVRERLVEILSSPSNHQTRNLLFGGGETFLRFGDFIDLVDKLLKVSLQRGIGINISCATNGTLLDADKLAVLAERGINLTFSIDGPETIHDMHRRRANGKGSFQSAIACWELYRALSRSSAHQPACDIISVITPDSRLRDIIAYWKTWSLPIFTCVPQLPSRFVPQYGTEELSKEQDKYLKDFEAFAFEQAQCLGVPEFLSQYNGPKDLYEGWKNNFLGIHIPPCLMSETIIAVDADGRIYPCDAFVGFKPWRIGDLFKGVSTKQLSEIKYQRQKAISLCENCNIQSSCPKGCLGGNPEDTMRNNLSNGCQFARALTRIVLESYRVLLEEKTSAKSSRD